MTDEELYKHLEKLTTKYEKYQKCPMYVQNMGEDFVMKEMKGAFGINIIPDEIFIKTKLSQNRNKNLDLIIENLQNSGDKNAHIIADKMRKVAADKDR